MRKRDFPSLRLNLPKKVKKINKWDWKKIGKIAAIIFGIGVLFVAGVFAYFAKDLPGPGKVNERFLIESTKIYDRTGEQILYEIHGEEKRTVIPFSEMPDTIKYATIALEDQDFYHHHGIKITSIIRSALKDVFRGSRAQGGSTITQQFIKNSLLSNEKTFTRKIKEAILSFGLEQKFSKDEILAMYLNEIPYGSNAYGIEAAAQTFFSKHAHELTLDEAALLAAIPQATTYYSPFGSHPEALKARQELTLTKMYKLGYINEEQMNEAIAEDIFAKINPVRENISAPHFVMYIKEYLEETYGHDLVEQGGLKVYTTLDWEKQLAAEKAVREGAEKNATSYNASNASLVAMDPQTGQILAMVGSKDYFDKSIDGQVNVSIRDRQPGSSFKPYVYLTAFQKGFTPETTIWDVDTDFETDTGSYNPKNYDNINRGPLKMKNALAMSLNVPAVKTLYLAGVQNSIDMAKSLGITSLYTPDRYGLSLVLGGGEVKLLDHVHAFSTLATGGMYHQKTAILRIEDREGEIIEEFQRKEGNRVVEEKYVAMLDATLSDNDLRSPVFGSQNPLRFDGRPVAAKTGTTNEWRDGWTMGYTPSLATGVWAGNNDNSPMAPGADGSYVAAPIWRQFMDEVLGNYQVESFPEYDQEEVENLDKAILNGSLKIEQELEVCEIPGEDDEYCLANDNCPKSKRDDKKFLLAHSILWYVDKNDPQGETPEKPQNDPQFSNWEKAVKEWASDQDDYTDREAPDDGCDEDDFEKYEPEIEIEKPSDGTTITNQKITIEVDGSAPYGTDKVTIYVDGNKITSKDDSSFSYSYTLPDSKNNSEIKIKAVIEDDNDNKDSDEVEVKVNF